MQRAFYPQYAALEDRHWWFLGRRAILLRLLHDRLGDASGLRALDVGCGTGGWLSCLARFGPVEAVDADADAVSFCHARGHAQALHVPTGEPLPFADASFDLVTALDVVEHVADDVALLRDVRRVCAAGALILVTAPAYRFLWGDQDVVSQHYRRYTGRQLRTALDAAGFDVEHLTYFNTALFPAVAAVRLLRRAVRAPRADRSDFETGPASLHRPLARLLAAEAGPVSRRGLPFGVSLAAVARPRVSAG